MGPPQAELGQHRIGLTREVAIGEKQQLHTGDELSVGSRRTTRDACRARPWLRRSR